MEFKSKYLSNLFKQFWADRNYIAWSQLAILLIADKQKFIQVFIYTSCLIGNCTLTFWQTLSDEHTVYIAVCEKTHRVYTFGHTSYNPGKTQSADIIRVSM